MKEIIIKIVGDYELIKAWGPVIVGIGSIVFGYYLNCRTLESKTKEEQRDEINKKLNEFYGPLTQLRGKSKLLYDLFRKDKEQGFRTLSALLNGVKFEGNDKILLEQIIKIDEQIERLIVDKSGYVENDELRDILYKAATHFNVISLAYNGFLNGEKSRFSDYLFPNELDEKIEEEVKKLHDNLEKLK